MSMNLNLPSPVAVAAGSSPSFAPSSSSPAAALRAAGSTGAGAAPAFANLLASDQAAADDAVDVLDASLMQALSELLGRAGPAAADATAGDAAAGAGDAGADNTDGDPAANPLPLAALPPAMQPAQPELAALAALAAQVPPAALAATAGQGAASSSVDGDVDAALSSLLAALPGRAADAASGTSTATSATPVPANPATTASASSAAPVAPAAPDPSAWMGLQRWSTELMSGALATTATTATSADAATLALPADRNAWQQPLMQALGDRLQLQIAARSEQAHLHLEPPQLGRIEIAIRQQGGALQVQFSATHDEVRQQLRQISEPLRHDLVQRHSGEVSVQVASGAGADTRGRDGAFAQQQGQQARDDQREQQRQPGRALSEAQSADGTATATPSRPDFAGRLVAAGQGLI